MKKKLHNYLLHLLDQKKYTKVILGSFFLLLLLAFSELSFAKKDNFVTSKQKTNAVKSVAEPVIIFVNSNATGANNGSGWQNAYTNLQTAINNASVGTQVWVALGTYQAAIGQSFTMKEGVEIYGGFTGLETELAQRNWRVNITKLQGNSNSVIKNDDNELTKTAILDGFTVTGGRMVGKAGDASVEGEDGNGGGMYNNNVSPTIVNCVFADNIAIGGAGINGGRGNGGGMYNNNSSPLIVNTVFSENKGIGGDGTTKGGNGNGGAIFNNNSSPIVMNTIICNNTVGPGANGGAAFGGGISNDGGMPKFINLTVYGNNGGITHFNSSPTITNCIISGNSEYELFFTGGSPTISYNLVKGGFAGIGNFDADPQFVNPSDLDGADNIWGTADDGLQLQNNSMAINGGSNVTTPSQTSFDLAGNQRTKGPAIDLGVYETNLGRIRLYVNAGATGNNDGGSWEDAYNKLETAVANAVYGDSIFVAAGTYQPLAGQSYSMKMRVKIFGGFVGTETNLNQRNWKINKTILQGNSNRVFINDNNNLLETTELDGFTIANGSAKVTDYSVSGGGMYNNNVSPTIRNCIFADNEAIGSFDGVSPTTGNGGGMYNIYASPKLINCVFVGNSAKGANTKDIGFTTVGNGGGMYNVDSSPMLVNCLFVNNSVLAGNGGFPIAQALGGAIYVQGGNPIFINLTVYGNSSGIANLSPITIFNSIIKNNGEYGVSNVYYYNEMTNNLIQDVPLFLDNFDADPQFVNPSDPDGADNIWGTADDGLILKNTSPALNAGNNEAIPSSIIIDITGRQRIQDGMVDMGAYEATPSVLPVTLGSFTANVEGNYAKLKWQTETELNNKTFLIYRSGDDKLFKQIGKVNGAGNSVPKQNYSYYDKLPLQGNNYYKLVQIDNDGKATELGVRTLNFSLSPLEARVYPNPTKHKVYFNLKLTGAYTIYNNLGQKVMQGDAASFGEGLDVSNLGVGVYHILIAGKSYKIVKQ